MLRIFRHYIPLPTIALSVVETFFVFCTFFLFHARLSAGAMRQQSVPVSLGFAFLVFTAMVALGLYNRALFGKHREMLRRIVVSFFLVLPVFLAGMAFLDHELKLNAPAPETYLPGMLLGLIAVAGTRFLVLPMIDVGALKRRVLVVGVGDLAERIEKLLQNPANRGFTVVDFVRFGSEPPRISRRYVDERTEAERRSLAAIADDKLVDEIVIATRDRRGLPIDDLLDCKLKGIQISEYLSFWERETGQIDLEALQPSWLFFSDGFRMNLVGNVVKRAFDVGVSLLFLTLTLPVIVLTAIAIRLDSKGPTFYLQERVGLGGRRFKVMKFRSMSVDAEAGGPRWAAANDQRITRIGALIRKTRIDEIPQVINVLRGDMSFIGPRPERPFFVETLAKEIPYYNERHRVKPGISGWAQINYPYGASVEDARQKLTYDLYYVKNRSLFLDFVILLQTARVVLWPEGVR